MKIAQVTAVFPPYRGGIGNVAFEYADKLTKAGHEVTVFTPGYDRKSKLKDTDFKIEYVKPMMKYGKAAVIPPILLQLFNFDIVHLHYPFYGGAELVALRDQIRKLPLVTTYHMDVIGKGIVNSVAKVHRKTLMPWVIKRSDKILVSSIDYAKQSQLQPFYQKISDRIVELPFTVDLDRFYPGRDELFRKSHSLPQDEPLILFVGGLDNEHYFKGLHVLIQALKKLENKTWHLVVVGDGNLRDTYQNEVNYLGLKDRICFHGSVSNELLPEYYRNADLFAFPSVDRSEAFGLVALEAQASGTPVVASNLPGVRTVIKNGKTGLLAEPNDVDDLTNKLEQLIGNSGRLKDMGEKARRRVEMKYSWEIILPRLLEVYNSVKK